MLLATPVAATTAPQLLIRLSVAAAAAAAAAVVGADAGGGGGGDGGAHTPITSFAIVVCEATQNLVGSPRFQEEDAAADVQHWLSQATGRNLSLHLSNESWCGSHQPSSATPVIAVGPAAARWCGLPASELVGLGLEGILVTSIGLAPGCIAATGARGAPRGTLYAGTELLELLGFRFLHKEQTVIPAANTTMPPSLHRRYVPQLEYRAFDDFTGTVTPRWVQHVRINSYGDWSTRWNRVEASGGSFDYAEGPPASNLTYPGFSHTAFVSKTQ